MTAAFKTILKDPGQVAQLMISAMKYDLVPVIDTAAKHYTEDEIVTALKVLQALAYDDLVLIELSLLPPCPWAHVRSLPLTGIQLEILRDKLLDSGYGIFLVENKQWLKKAKDASFPEEDWVHGYQLLTSSLRASHPICWPSVQRFNAEKVDEGYVKIGMEMLHTLALHAEPAFMHMPIAEIIKDWTEEDWNKLPLLAPQKHAVRAYAKGTFKFEDYDKFFSNPKALYAKQATKIDSPDHNMPSPSSFEPCAGCSALPGWKAHPSASQVAAECGCGNETQFQTDPWDVVRQWNTIQRGSE